VVHHHVLADVARNVLRRVPVLAAYLEVFRVVWMERGHQGETRHASAHPLKKHQDAERDSLASFEWRMADHLLLVTPIPGKRFHGIEELRPALGERVFSRFIFVAHMPPCMKADRPADRPPRVHFLFRGTATRSLFLFAATNSPMYSAIV